jgi:hypothetical protein
MLTVSVLVWYTVTGEFSLPVPVTGCDLPIDFHELVRSLFPGEVDPCGSGPIVSTLLAMATNRGRRVSCNGLSGVLSGLKPSTSR